ncbi:hypothetical protein AWB64_04604 [Caballeronia sordidicola]|uniref:Uncharacterized protein n=2 Tax=Caballeronia sordidicola TaxID=196367 RepID=A0A158HG80_CABSO|nr:hypothetical protein AWB64_04604 [Caballeronia sordidicola]
MIGDVSHLPFSRAEGERLRGQAEADGIRPKHTSPWSLLSTKPPEIELLEPRNYDPENPASIRLRRMAGRPILKVPIRLPEVDPRGISSATSFECWKKACDSKIGVAGYYYSFKGQGRVACHSHLEARLLHFFEMCPLVVEIRTQYPQWDREDFREYCLSGARYPEPRLRTIDFMLTLMLPGIPYYVYHGVSAKPSGKLDEPRVVTRHQNEADGLWEWGGTHEPMSELTVSPQEARNYDRMLAAMEQAEPEDIVALSTSAATLAQKLRTTKAQGSMDRILSMVGRRQQWSFNETYRIFAIAFFLGHLRWNHREKFDPTGPLCLVW